MIERPFWQRRIQEAWKRAPIAWLAGVRRVGKTTLAKFFREGEYLNCDLARNRERLSDPEFFFDQCAAEVVVLDEVHKLENPSELLKIAADEFPEKKILATGSSTLAATSKFRDSLTGRKRVISFPPVLASELAAFGISSLETRLLWGGLPPCLIASDYDPGFYAEWLDSYYARDVQELFRVSKRTEFLKLTELLLRHSGGLAEILSLAKQSGLTRPTVMNYLEILEITQVIHRLRPFHDGGKREILAQPKIYGFDTGFICYARGWKDLRPEDRGGLLENLVLDLIKAVRPSSAILYWRDKQQREVDFVLPGKPGKVTAIECKWKARNFDPAHLEVFRSYYPKGENLLVTAGPGKAVKQRFGGIEVTVVPVRHLLESLEAIT